MGEQWENYSRAHSMGGHVGVCQWSNVLMDNHLSFLDQVGNKNERTLPSSNQKYRISMAWDCCLLILLLMMPTVVVLSM
jgi:hypothetical protein